MVKQTETAVLLSNVVKRFGRVVANDKVSLEVRRGEILALLGENGSGKTTLMNMLSGIYYPDEGQIFVNGQEVRIGSPKDAFSLGIGMIHQHFKLVDVLTAAENIILGLPGKAKINRAALAGEIREISQKYGFRVDPNKKIYNMSVSEKQTVEIIKVLYRGADILILDEPTAVLTPQETDRLFDVLRKMKADNKAIIIITHKMHEVLSVSDRVAILRKGQVVGTVETKDANRQNLTEMMVGHAVSLKINRPQPAENGQEALKIEGLTCLNSDGIKALDNVSFTLRSGEIMGVAGIAGSGQKELCEAITGLCPVQQGAICLSRPEGENLNIVGLTPTEIIRSGISMAFVPEDRLGMGLVASMDIVDNTMLKSYKIGKGPFLDRKTPRALAKDIVGSLEIVTPGLNAPVRLLSGGNVQKVLLGREIASKPMVLIAAYPVRGLDINSSYRIYDLLNEQKKKGVAVLYIGEDLDVLLELCDWIIVLCGGRVSGILDASQATKEEIGLKMTHIDALKEADL
ncbi:MAG: ABC transporter ATP-binding protein [Bacillota bacterium]|nr:ABC transporter ATP-binding protein [Bacillota bacterium]